MSGNARNIDSAEYRFHHFSNPTHKSEKRWRILQTNISKLNFLIYCSNFEIKLKIVKKLKISFQEGGSEVCNLDNVRYFIIWIRRRTKFVPSVHTRIFTADRASHHRRTRQTERIWKKKSGRRGEFYLIHLTIIIPKKGEKYHFFPVETKKKRVTRVYSIRPSRSPVSARKFTSVHTSFMFIASHS